MATDDKQPGGGVDVQSTSKLRAGWDDADSSKHTSRTTSRSSDARNTDGGRDGTGGNGTTSADGGRGGTGANGATTRYEWAAAPTSGGNGGSSGRDDAGDTSGAALGTGTGSAAKGASRTPVSPTGTAEAGPGGRTRRVRLTLASVDPFSVMKLSFLVAIAIGIATVIAVVLLWNIVNVMGIWGSLDSLGRDLNAGEPLPFMQIFNFSRFVSYGTIVAVVNVVIITALGTLLAFLYNIVASLLGGVTMTYTDD